MATTVKKVLSELPDVSVEEHAKLKEEVKKFEEKRDPAEVKQDIAKMQEDLKKLEEAMAKLEEQKAKDPVLMVDIEKLLKELEMLEKERNERRDRVTALTDEAEKLKARLDTTPRYVPPPPVQVRLPNPKTMPEQAVIHHVLVSGNKLMPVRIQELQTAVENELAVVSYFLIPRNRFEAHDYQLLSGERQDRFRLVDGELKLARREIILDMSVLSMPNLAIFL